jgi:hypothetical protein
MIIGLGSDLIDIRRVEKSIERFGERFLSRIFTDTERHKSDGRPARRELCQALCGQGGLFQGVGHRACARACSGATWVWSTCRAASRASS